MEERSHRGHCIIGVQVGWVTAKREQAGCDPLRPHGRGKDGGGGRSCRREIVCKCKTGGGSAPC